MSSRVRAELRERFWGDPGRHFPSAVYFIAFFDSVCGADLAVTLFGGRVWQLRNPGVSTPRTLHKLANEGSPWTKTPIYAVEPRPASAEGTLPDVRGRRADAYRHCVVAGCRLSMDLTTNAIGFLMAHPGRWVDLSLSSRDEFLRFAWTTSAHL